ncbi:putative Agenet-like domain-containing protein [Medicago truncatula]|uniref:Agenet domain protein n=1 Tax=Medicago truncatula TaxID=3880 RepID=G7J9E2_MEDTR|nr:protein AGENET DOMAIN (AGD)-CONTAINING P1 [Medicago truncatula]AES70977.1 agenet domain protein [Medicago truncatula]RHN68132.1 putative Agenet-like domain-containing protein [Medicago truncatula]
MRPPMRIVNYRVGDLVEVCIKDEGFWGSYFEAKIVACLENGEYVVRYKNLLENDESGPLEETLLSKDLRPIPPSVQNPSAFQLNQKVDVFCNDGWWLGKITSKKVFRRNHYYIWVYFPTISIRRLCRCDQIRVHHELSGGDWITRS